MQKLGFITVRLFCFGGIKMHNKRCFFLVLTALVLLSSTNVYADRYHRGGGGRGGYYGRGYYGYNRGPSFGLYFGSPFYSRPYYAYPYQPYYPYYPPAIVTVPVNPPVYIERSQPQPAQPLSSGFWYYCNDPEGYYPYVQECPNGWRQVDPIPPQ